MATTAANVSHTPFEFRTGKVASFITSSAGFLALGADEETDHVLRNEVQPLEMHHPRPPADYAALGITSIWTKWVTNAPLTLYPSAKGGVYPYLWFLVGAPSGMTISSILATNTTYADAAAHGRITWTSPAAGTHTFSVRCMDQLGTVVTQTVSLHVADSNAIWVDAVSGTDSVAAAGTKAAPFKKIGNWYGGAGGTGVAGDRADTTYSGKLVIFRAGTYVLPVDESTNNLNVGTNKPCSWVAYNGETVVLDCSSSAVRMTAGNGAGNNYVFESIGLTTYAEDITKADTFQYYLSAYTRQLANKRDAGHVILCDHIIDSYKNRGTNVAPDNPAAIRNADGTAGSGNWAHWYHTRNIRVRNLGGGAQPLDGTQPSFINWFGLANYETNNVWLESQDGECTWGVKMKHQHRQGVSRNLMIPFAFASAYAPFFMMSNTSVGDADLNELEYSFLHNPDAAFTVTDSSFLVNDNNVASDTFGDMFVRRCTLSGNTPRLTQWADNGTSFMTKGANVIQVPSGDWTIHASWTGDYADESTEIKGTSGIIDTDGLLTGASRTAYLGTKGWEIV